ncbi:MAG: DUF1579 domain-containing protein [Acidobacteriota bacterium]|nr:DUF1579 domain-containing protein [Acidobacteriota bacterium]
MRKLIFYSIVVLAFFASVATTNRLVAQEPLDGRNRIFRDELLENLTGDWKLTHKIRGQSVENTAQADWALNHQFLRLHMKDVRTPANYEAMIFIGYDNTSERYVAHWIDVFGGRFSETLGYGTRSGNAIKFVFENPDGPFHNTLTWNPETKMWTFLMQSKDKTGKWQVFAEDSLRRP